MQKKFLDWARSEDRRQVEVPAIVYRTDDTRMGVLISDLSYEGCQLAVSQNVPIGEQIRIVILELGAEVSAVVRWAAASKLGVQFCEVQESDDPLDSPATSNG